MVPLSTPCNGFSVCEREYNEREKLVITFQLHVMDSCTLCLKSVYARRFNLSTPCNGFWKTVFVALKDGRIILSTPCNGFISKGKHDVVVILKGAFQLHVMDSPLSKPIPGYHVYA